MLKNEGLFIRRRPVILFKIMKILIISDLHTKIDWVEEFLSKTKHDLVIFLGDYFDCWDDDPVYNAKAASWLSQSVKKNNRIHLLGNHDLAYRFSSNPAMYCPGFTNTKCRAVHAYFPRELWNKLRLYYNIDNFLFTHAGINSKFLTDDNNQLNKEWLDWYCKDSLVRATYTNSPFLTDCESIVWLRWPKLNITDGINQVVGHTIHDEPQVNIQPEIIDKKERNFNVCLDTQCKHYGILESGRFGYNEVGSDEKNIVWVN